MIKSISCSPMEYTGVINIHQQRDFTYIKQPCLKALSNYTNTSLWESMFVFRSWSHERTFFPRCRFLKSEFLIIMIAAFVRNRWRLLVVCFLFVASSPFLTRGTQNASMGRIFKTGNFTPVCRPVFPQHASTAFALLLDLYKWAECVPGPAVTVVPSSLRLPRLKRTTMRFAFFV